MKTKKPGLFQIRCGIESAEQKQRTENVIVRRLDGTYVGKVVAEQVQDLIFELRRTRRKAKRRK